MRRLGTLILPALFFASSANAAITMRIGIIEDVQLNSHIRVGYEDVVSIKLTGAWPGVNCAADVVWFNAKEDPQFVATVLQARATGGELKVYVDDSLPKLGTICHVMTLAVP
jgi:hypothetical protein